MLRLSMLTLLLVICWTGFCFSQSARQQLETQTAIDAVQDVTIQTLQDAQQADRLQIATLTLSMASLRSSLDRFTGIGIGFGSTLTVLVSLQTALMWQKKQPLP